MKPSRVVITVQQQEDGIIEMGCQCVEGESQNLNQLAHHIANQLPMPVQTAIKNFYSKKDSNNAIH